MPVAFQLWGELFAVSLRKLHPDWEMKLWTDENIDVDGLSNRVEYLAADVPAMKADILRYELLLRFGGVYVDCDVEPAPNHSLEELIDVGEGQPHEMFLGREDQHHVCNAVMGSVPGHPFMRQVVRNLSKSITMNWHRPVPERTGPTYLTRQLMLFPMPSRVTVLSPLAFYPYHHTQKGTDAANGPFEWSYAIHHWANSWG